MGKLVAGDDGLPAEGIVGPWVEDKHGALRGYLTYHAAPRQIHPPRLHRCVLRAGSRVVSAAA
jgi:hypothetical protein